MFAVVMCGGSGTRFWPASRKQRPKQFLDITGKGPMIVETCGRLRPIIRDEEMVLILGKKHLAEARQIFDGREISMLAEPVGRNTAPCIGLGAIYARYRNYNGPVAFLPADHFIGDPGAFLKSLQTGGDVAETGGIATIGIVPNRPETGYGYIKRGEPDGKSEDRQIFSVSQFVKKPDLETAVAYLASGDYYWNGGIFVATPETILKETKRQLPELYAGLLELEKVFGTDDFEPAFQEVYENLASVSFDYGIMENIQEPVYVIPSQCGWSDVGSWESLYELRSSEQDNDGNLGDGGNIFIDCEGTFASGRSGRMIACLGLKNCLVVDTEDSLLVADLKNSQDIRKVVDLLKETGRDDLL